MVGKAQKEAHLEKTALLFPSLQAQEKGGGKPKGTGNSNASSCLIHFYPTLLLSPVICPLKLCSQLCFHLLPREAGRQEGAIPLQGQPDR